MDRVTGMARNQRDVCSTSGVGRHPVHMFQDMQINDHAKFLGIMVGPGGNADRWTAPRNIFRVFARIRASFQGSVQRLVSFKSYALSIPTFVGSMAEPDTKTMNEETNAQ